jgi:hypothetical protein
MRQIGGKQAFVVALAAIFVLATASPATADPRYEVMNAPEGVYWRSEPNWAAAERITGFGVYNGTIVEVHCYQSGTAVEGSADTMWEQATDVGGRGYGSGWLNEHFVNDSQPINQPSPGVGPCNPPPHEESPVEKPAEPVEEHPGSSGGGSSSSGSGTSYHDGGSIYYSPYNGSNIDYRGGHLNKYAPSEAQRNIDISTWNAHGGCHPVIPNYDGEDAGSRITTISAWSIARNVPFALLDADPSLSWIGQVNYILLFDPGTYENYEKAKCEPSAAASKRLAIWLAESSGHHLVVLAGEVVAHDKYRGIQHFLFASAKNYHNHPGQDIRKQIIVCPYPSLSHEDTWIDFHNQIKGPPITNINSCPSSRGVAKPTGWTP